MSTGIRDRIKLALVSYGSDLVGSELCRVDEHGPDNYVTLRPRSSEKFCVTFVECSHGWNEANS